MNYAVTSIVQGYPPRTFWFVDQATGMQWLADMTAIRANAPPRTIQQCHGWLVGVKNAAVRWGVGHIPLDIKDATAMTENSYISDGNFLDFNNNRPIFRGNFTMLEMATWEFMNSSQAGNWAHEYKAVNGQIQRGPGVPPVTLDVNSRNKLEYAEITYRQRDRRSLSVRFTTWKSGHEWHQWVVNFWHLFSNTSQIGDEATKTRAYRQHLTTLTVEMENYGHDVFPPNIRAVIHDLQDLFGEDRTAFEAPPLRVRVPRGFRGY